MTVSIDLVIAGSSSLLMSAMVCYALSRWSAKARLMALPRADRWHEKPTPNTGGLGILFACAFSYLLFTTTHYAAIAGCAAAVSILGFLDDRVQLPPWAKLLGQSAAATLVMWSGVMIHLTPWTSVDAGVTFLWIVGITNAFNLIDNMDGLCGGVAAIVAVSGASLAILQHDGPKAVVLMSVAGACLGFLLLNHKPARIFMGDCGSLFLGFSLATLAIIPAEHGADHPIVESLYPLAAFLYPVFDVALVSVTRRSAGRPISAGGRDHSSHRLASLGISEQKAVWLLWACAAVCASWGPLAYRNPVWFIAGAALLMAGLAVFGSFLASLPGFSLPASAPIFKLQFRSFIPTVRATAIVLLDTVLCVIALLIAFTLWWQGRLTEAHVANFLKWLPMCMGVQVVASVTFRNFGSGWRWFGLDDLMDLGRSSAGAAITLLIVMRLVGTHFFTPGILVLYALLFLLLTAGVRGFALVLWRVLPVRKRRRAALLGDCESAEAMIRVLQSDHSSNTAPAAVLTMGPSAGGVRIHGVPIVNAEGDINTLLRRLNIEVLILSPHQALTVEQQELLTELEAAGVPIEQLEVNTRAWHAQQAIIAAR